MLKARAGKAVFLGLTHRNLELMREGKPVHVELKDVKYGGSADDLTVTIFTSKDNASLVKIIQEVAAIKPEHMAALRPYMDKPEGD